MYILLLLSCLSTLSYALESGCTLVPPTNTSAVTSSSQYKILDHLRDDKLYGKRFSCKGPSNKFDYTFSICDDASAKKIDAAIVRNDAVQGNAEISLGSRKATNVYGNDEVFMLHFTLGDKFTENDGCKNTNLSSVVIMMCDADKPKGEFTYVQFDTVYCQFTFELKLSALCDHLPGLSGWSIFFIILIVGFSVYFLSGFLYLRYKINARGIDQIPNRTFWIGIGNKLADGCGAVCRCDRFCGDGLGEDLNSYSSGYSEIGDTNQSSQGGPFRSQPVQNDSPLLQP